MIKVKKVPKGEDDEKVSLGLHEMHGWSHTVADSFQSPKYAGTLRYFMGQCLPDHHFVLLAKNGISWISQFADGTIGLPVDR